MSVIIGQGNQAEKEAVTNALETHNNAEGNINGHVKFNWLGNHSLASMLFGQSNENILNLIKTMNKVLNEKFDMSARGFNLKLIKIDKTVSSDIPYEFICVVLYTEDPKYKIVGYHPLLIIDSKTKLSDTPITINGTNYFHHHVASDLINQELIDNIKKYVAKHVPVENAILAYAQCGILFTDKVNTQDEQHVANLLGNSAAACHDAMRVQEIKLLRANQADSTNDINLINDKQEEKLEVVRTINNNVLLDTLGVPINRTGFEVQFLAKTKNQKDNKEDKSFNSINVNISEPLALVHGYVDIKPYVDTNGNCFNSTGQFFSNYVGQNNQVNGQTLVYGGNVPKNYFAANIVITNLSQMVNHSLGNQLMSLAVAIDNLVVDDKIHGLFWADILNPLNQPKEDLHSIAGLSYEISAREGTIDTEFKPLNVHSNKFDNETYKVFMNQYFVRTPTVSMLIPRNNLDSWKYTTLVKAAWENSTAADKDSLRKLIYDTANVLTNNVFGRYYKELNGNGSIVTCKNNVVYHGTYYNTVYKQRRSLQDISFSYLLNMVDKRPQFFNDFVVTYAKATTNNVSSDNTAATYNLILQKYVLDNVVTDVEILGVSDEITFESAFIVALHSAIKEVLKNPIENKSFINKTSLGNNSYSANYLTGAMVNINNTFITGPSANINTYGYFNPNVY